MKHIGIVALITYIATIFAANWAVQEFGAVSVGFGLMAPAAVFFVGLAFTGRDLVHELLGRNWAIGAIVVGAALSYLVAPSFAVASGAAFLASETADLIVYTPLRRRKWLAAVAASNLAGDVIDSSLFLWLAFGNFDFLKGQLVGKYEMTLIALPILFILRRRIHR